MRFGFHRANLAFRAVLELAAVVGFALGGYNIGAGFVAWVFAIVVPIAAAAVWGTFNVPGDASRSGRAPVAVSGRVRLYLELLFFAYAAILIASVSGVAAAALAVAVGVHYALSLDRINWLLDH